MAAAILALKAEGVGIVLAEQNLHFAERLGDRAVVIEKGSAVWAGSLAALAADDAARQRFLAVGVET
jgi:branched-chain amino acid transport system ATP-binding protein